MNKFEIMMVAATMMLAYLYFVYSKTKPQGKWLSEEGDPCPRCPLTKDVPVTSVAPPSEHCGEDLQGLDVHTPDDAVKAYHYQQEAFTQRKLANPELAPVLRAIA